MGVDDMMVSFALSYIAGNIPQIKEWLQGRKDLQDKISKCYDRALKKWTVNDGIRATTMEGSFGTQKEHYAMRRIKARKKKTEILDIFFGIHTANVV